MIKRHPCNRCDGEGEIMVLIATEPVVRRLKECPMCYGTGLSERVEAYDEEI